MKHALVLMTALLPTRGHAELCEFAARFPATHLWVLINGRSHEPVSGELRATAVLEALSHLPRVTVRLAMTDEAPQNPGDHPRFWEWWRDEANRHCPEVGGEWDYVVASEPYGAQVAKSLGAEFMPYDLGRELNAIRGRDARRDPWGEWEQLLPGVRRAYQFRATLFGQESVGKTTVSRRVSELLSAPWLFEYARPYQELLAPEVDLKVMEAIHRGQVALQESAFYRASAPAVILDTDLFSTVGYYGIMGESPPAKLVEDARRLASSVYYVLGDEVAFEPDPLRYGGDRRESSVEYWEELLTAEALPWLRVPAGSVEEQAAFIAKDVRRRFTERMAPIAAFERE